MRPIDLLRRCSALMLAIFLAPILVSCTSTEPEPHAPSPTYLTVSCVPTELEATWQLTGPEEFLLEASGDTVITGLAIGTYSMQWGDIEPWTTPLGETRHLAEGASVSFAGNYGLSPGSIVIDVEPDESKGEWSLQGPSQWSRSGTGDRQYTDLPPGEYTVDWYSVRHWLPPDREVAVLAPNSSLTLQGEYRPVVGLVVIDPSPDHLGAGWTLEGINKGLSISGTGDDSLYVAPDSYQLYWHEMSGWSAPAFELARLVADSTIFFDVTYVEFVAPAEPEFVALSAGSFDMGARAGEVGSLGEGPLHSVTLTRSFLIQNTEVTNGQFVEMANWAIDNGYAHIEFNIFLEQRFLKCSSTSPPFSLGVVPDGLGVVTDRFDTSLSTSKARLPVTGLTWYMAAAYCDWMNWREGLPPTYRHHNWDLFTGDPYSSEGYRLPTEAEWEYACRAGSITAFANGESTDEGCEDPILDQIAWYCGTAGGQGVKHEVGMKIPNAWGLHDMHGNAYEWCQDGYAAYAAGPVVDPTGSGATDRVQRGGYFRYDVRHCRSAARFGRDPRWEYAGGVRPVRTIP